MSHDINDGNTDTGHDLKNSYDPYDLFCKGAYHPKVYEANNKGNREHEGATSISAVESYEEDAYKSMIVLVERPTVLAPP